MSTELIFYCEIIRLNLVFNSHPHWNPNKLLFSLYCEKKTSFSFENIRESFYFFFFFILNKTVHQITFKKLFRLPVVVFSNYFTDSSLFSPLHQTNAFRWSFYFYIGLMQKKKKSPWNNFTFKFENSLTALIKLSSTIH